MKIFKTKRSGFPVAGLVLGLMLMIFPVESVAQQSSWDKEKQHHLQKKLEQIRERLGKKVEGTQKPSLVPSGIDISTLNENYTIFEHDQSWNRNPNPYPARNFALFNQGQPAGNINGDASTNGHPINDFVVTGSGRDETTPALEDQTFKTAVFFGGNTSGEPDQIIYQYLIPVGDLNGDGFADAVAGHGSNSQRLEYPSSADNPYIYKGTTNGYQKTNSTITEKLSDPTIDFLKPAIGFNDFNRDGYGDILTYSRSGSQLFIFWGASNLSDISTPTVYDGILTNDYKRLAVKDVDQDSLLEVVELSGVGPEGQIRILEIDSLARQMPQEGILVDQSFAYPLLSASAPQAGLQLIDIDGNGFSEILISESWLPRAIRSKYILEYDSTLDLYNTIPTEFFNGLLVPAGDLNSDGYHDFIIGDSTDSDKPHIAYGHDDLSTPLSFDEYIDGTTGNEWSAMEYNPYGTFGDFNGDGVDDVLIPYFEEKSSTGGRLIINGISNESESHSSVFHEYQEENFYSLIRGTEELGDINGDGIDDFAIGLSSQGRIEIYYGGDTISQTPDKTIESVDPFMMTSGDFNGDGTHDLLVMGFSNQTKVVKMYFGGNSMDAIADFSLRVTDFQSFDYPDIYGVQNIGDINKDGNDDFLTGSSYAHDSTTGGKQYANEAYIFYGGSSISSSPDVTISLGGSGEDYVWAGETAASLGDVNGDDIDDFAVSAAAIINDDGTSGKVQIYYGGAGKFFSEPDMVLFPERQTNYFGWSIGAGDFTGDGNNDIAVSSVYFGDSVEPAAVHIYHGGSDNSADQFLDLPDFTVGENIGIDGYIDTFFFGKLEVIKDFTNDGKDELLYSSRSTRNHAALYTFIKSTPNPNAVLKAPNPAAGLGGLYEMASGDFDNDGQPDVVLSQVDDNNDANNSSRVYRYGLPAPIHLSSVKDVPDDQGGWVRVSVDGFFMDAVSENIYGFDSWAVRMMTEDSSWTSLATVQPYENDSKFVDVPLPKTQPTGIDSVDHSYQLKIVAYDYTDDNENRVIAESDVLNAKALDNLAPAKVQGVAVEKQDGLPVISWNAVDDVNDIEYLVFNADSFSEGPIGSTKSTRFTLPDSNQGIQNFVVRALDVNNNLGAPSEPVSAIYPQTVDYDMTKGWNLIGFPVEVDAETVESIISEVNHIYEYDGSYKLVEELKRGKGYWAKVSTADLYELTGLPFSEVTLELEKGWNLISGVGTELPLSAVEDPDEIIIPGTLTSFGKMYVTTDTLKPGIGYWIRTSAAGSIILKHPAFIEVEEQPKVNSDDKAKDIDEIFNTVTVSDDQGHFQKLYFGSELPDDFNKLSYTLPPLPPGDLFDARFKQNRLLTQSNQIQISLKKLEGSSLSIQLNVKSLAEYGAFSVREFGEGQLLSEYTIEPGKQIQLAHSETDAIYLAPVGSSLAGSETPEKFALEQNYPNPFNPTTRIEYSVAETTPVTLKVFNILGKRVATLVDKEQQPGFYDVTFDGSGLASGLYLYRLKAGNYISIKKFILAK